MADARELPQADASFDVALLLGPLYHLTAAADRARALSEAYRVLRPGGLLVAVAISRFASTLRWSAKGLSHGPSVPRDRCPRSPRWPTSQSDRRPRYFMNTFFHHPEDLRGEVIERGFEAVEVHGVEGPAWMLHDLESWWEDTERREHLLSAVQDVEQEPSLWVRVPTSSRRGAGRIEAAAVAGNPAIPCRGMRIPFIEVSWKGVVR